MERRVDITRVQRTTASGARLFVKDVRAKLKKGADALFGFKTWKAFERAVARARFNDYRRRHGRSRYRHHDDGAQQLARTHREGSAAWHAWHAWQNERRR